MALSIESRLLGSDGAVGRQDLPMISTAAYHRCLSVGRTVLSVHVHVDESETAKTSWHQLLEAEGLSGDWCNPESDGETEGEEEPDPVAGCEEDIVDHTPGYPVTGYIDGNQTMVFNWPAADHSGENRIPVKGLYVPSQKHMRLIGLISILL